MKRIASSGKEIPQVFFSSMDVLSTKGTKKQLQQVSNLRPRRGSDTRSFQSIVSSNRFQRLASVGLGSNRSATCPCLIKVRLSRRAGQVSKYVAEPELSYCKTSSIEWRISPSDISHGAGGVECIEHKKRGQSGFEPAPSERTR